MEFIIIIIGILVDRLTKIWAIKSLSSGKEIVIIRNIFSFQYLENRGAAWGIFQNKLVFLSTLTFVVVCMMIFYLIKKRPSSRLLRASLSMVIGGALGNLYDRTIYHKVVDFILFHYKDVYNFPTFNVADMFVVVGTCMLALYIIKEGK